MDRAARQAASGPAADRSATRREVPPIAHHADHPETAAIGVEGKPGADREGRPGPAFTEIRIAEETGGVHRIQDSGILTLPPLRDTDIHAQLIQYALHNEVYQIGDLGGTVVEARRGRDHDGARLGDLHQVPQVD